VPQDLVCEEGGGQNYSFPVGSMITYGEGVKEARMNRTKALEAKFGRSVNPVKPKKCDSQGGTGETLGRGHRGASCLLAEVR